jgi:hypothetical protein
MLAEAEAGSADRPTASMALMRVRAHVAECSSCAAELAVLVHGARAMALLAERPVRASLGVLPPLPANVPSRQLLFRRLAVAAAIVITTALGAGIFFNSRSEANLELVALEDVTPESAEVWASIEDFAGLDGEWLAAGR